VAALLHIHAQKHKDDDKKLKAILLYLFLSLFSSLKDAAHLDEV
jgi:hypothetical protein